MTEINLKEQYDQAVQAVTALVKQKHEELKNEDPYDYNDQIGTFYLEYASILHSIKQSVEEVKAHLDEDLENVEIVDIGFDELTTTKENVFLHKTGLRFVSNQMQAVRSSIEDDGELVHLSQVAQKYADEMIKAKLNKGMRLIF